MNSLRNGNIAAIKKGSKVKSWSGFRKIFSEWREIVLKVGEALPQLKYKEKESMVRKETPETDNFENKLSVQTQAEKI